MNTEIIRLINITSHQHQATMLDGISLNLLKGEIVGIHSLSTSQRSAILDMICGQLPPDSGSIFIYGKHLLRYSDIRSALPKLIRITSEPILISSFTVWENLMLYGRARRSAFIHRKLLQQYTTQLLQEFGFPPCCNTYCDQLPFVYRYALQILKVWDTDSSLVILDDCLPNLTVDEYTFLFGFIHKLTDLGISFLISSRYLFRLSKFCDRIFCIDQHRTCREFGGNASAYSIAFPVRCEGYQAFTQSPGYIGCIDKEFAPGVTLHIPFLEGKNTVIVDTTKSLSAVCTARSTRKIRKQFLSGLCPAFSKQSRRDNRPLIAEYGLHGYVSPQLSPIMNISLGISRQFSFLGFLRPTILKYLNHAFSEWCQQHDIPINDPDRQHLHQTQAAMILYKLHLTNPKLLLFHYNGTASTIESINSLVETEFQTHKQNGMAICTICSNIEHIPSFADRFILITQNGIYYDVNRDYLNQIVRM